MITVILAMGHFSCSVTRLSSQISINPISYICKYNATMKAKKDSHRYDTSFYNVPLGVMIYGYLDLIGTEFFCAKCVE